MARIVSTEYFETDIGYCQMCRTHDPFTFSSNGDDDEDTETLEAGAAIYDRLCREVAADG